VPRIRAQVAAGSAKCSLRHVPDPRPAPFPDALRVKRPEDFDRAYRLRRRHDLGALIVYAAPNGLPACRLGLSVSRKVGGAVQRNRLKRMLREAFRHLAPELPAGMDLVIVARRHDEWSPERYARALVDAAEKLSRPGHGTGS
jgi:ribonuclease P protein component